MLRGILLALAFAGAASPLAAASLAVRVVEFVRASGARRCRHSVPVGRCPGPARRGPLRCFAAEPPVSPVPDDRPGRRECVLPQSGPDQAPCLLLLAGKTVRVEAVRQGPVANGAFRQARSRRARLQHSRRDERVHRGHRQRMDGAHQRAGNGCVRGSLRTLRRASPSGIPICALRAASFSKPSVAASGSRASASASVRLPRCRPWIIDRCGPSAH